MPVNSVLISPKTDASPRRSLMLAGGGIRVAYQAGVMMALQEQGLQFSHVDGTSGGIFNAGMLASGLTVCEITRNWRKVSIKHFSSPSPLKSYFKPLNMKGYADADGIRNNVFPTLGIDWRKINANDGIQTTFNVCNFADKTVESISGHQVSEDHLIAGVSLPIVMPAIQIDGVWYSDSVWIKDTNLVEGVKRGAEELWLIWAIGNFSEYLPGALNQYVHMIEMSANGGLLEEYARIKLMKQQPNPDSDYIPGLKLHVIKPDIPLPLDTDLYLNKVDARTLINMGYADGKRYLQSIPPSGVPFSIEATKMKNPGSRLNFRYVFKGSLVYKSRTTSFHWYPSFCWREKDSKTELSFVSSLKINDDDNEISTFNNRIRFVNKEKQRILLAEMSCMLEGEQHHLQAELVLTNSIDWFLGIAFKRLKISLQRNTKLLAEGMLFNEFNDRLASVVSRNFRKQDGSCGNIVQRYKSLTKLYRYEF
ncbi:patatin-like phospholipase family protein [Mangrovibacterium lignilyticum]|uniref:patatin-like phospholipase family protein n=1 Tax=Mangrovibacterium lignilyticum TaxID=2668052 RepID=UPI0013D3D98C|nr:patatin-like phospholipase family protein [Mangrovibacterium lignilyticum]